LKGATILGSFAAQAIQVAGARDVDLSGPLHALSLSPGALAADDARVAAHAVVELWGAAARASGDPDFGLHAGAATTPASLGALGYALATSATIADALERCARYARLLDTAGFSVVEEGGRVWLRFRPGAGRPYAEAIVAAVVAMMRQLTGADVRPVFVAFEHPRPPSVAEHERILGATPVFGHAAGNWVAFDAALLAMPCVRADPALARHLDRSARAALAELPIEGVVRARVCDAIAARLEDGEAPSATSIARHLALTTRTLHRRLRAEGTTFSVLVDEARFARAAAWLRDASVSTDDIARRLGFSETSAFSRAFRRWAGESPRAFRRRLTGTAKSDR
jgi:AraC-like DNA-binding protein